MGCYIKRILTFSTPVVYGEVKILNLSNVDITENCSFSWSSDNICWTSWTSYQNYLTIARNIESDFYLRILFMDTLGKVYLNNLVTECYTTCIMPMDFSDNLCSSTIFNPYANLDCALQLQQQLADSVICMLGIPAYYFHVKPEHDTADYTFKEYIIHNVESVKMLKIMVNEGELPSSKPSMSEWDFDWENGWEVEMSKTEFARAFGDESFPKTEDFVYVPMMKRMWSVSGAYDEKQNGLMWRSTTWTLQLSKYNDKTNVGDGDYEELISNLTDNSYMNVFRDYEDKEQYRQTGTDQTIEPKYAATNLYNIYIEDAVRSALTNDTINIIDKQLNNGSTVVVRNMYKMCKENSQVHYQRGFCGYDGTLSFIIDIQPQDDKYPIISCGDVNIYSASGENDTCVLEFGDCNISLDINNIYMVIAKWNKETFTTELCAYKYITRAENIPSYKLRPEMYQFDLNNPITSVGVYNNDYAMNDETEVVLYGYPHTIGNFKLFNEVLENKLSIMEATKYSTTCPTCIINDLARPLTSGHGYNVR